MNDFRKFDCSSPFDGSSDDVLRRHWHLSRRSAFAIVRDLWRGYADVDLLSHDAKAGNLLADANFTGAELRAAYFRRLKWKNTY